MKLLFFIPGAVFTANVVCCQTTFKKMPQQKIDELNEKLKGMKFNKGLPYHISIDTSTGKFSFNQLHPPGIYSLPQDNMVCIVPDRTDIANIPNGIKVHIPFNTTIPNPYPAQPALPEAKR
jgi:hypothetical protein